MVNNAADRYGVMGYPVSHSRSPVIHRLFALQTGQNLQYELLQVAPDKLETAIRLADGTVVLAPTSASEDFDAWTPKGTIKSA